MKCYISTGYKINETNPSTGSGQAKGRLQGRRLKTNGMEHWNNELMEPDTGTSGEGDELASGW